MSLWTHRRTLGFEARVDELQHVVAVLDHIELVVKNRFDLHVFADDEGVAPRQTHQRPEHVEGFGDAFVRVGDERKRNMKLTGETTLRIELVRAYADEVGAGEQELVEIIAEGSRFAGAVRGKRFGKKVDDRTESGLFGQYEFGATVCLGGDLGCPVPHFQRRHWDDGAS